MSFLNLVLKRQSVRSYKQDPVSHEIIDRCIEAARLAPSACNSQPWSFIVVDSPKIKSKVASAIFGGMYSMCSFAESAPVLIAVITEKSKLSAAIGGHIKGTKYNLIDIGIACEHLVLQAAEEGLGTCWLGWFNEKKVKKELDLPKSTKIDVIISLGYPLDETIREKQRKSIDEIRRYV